MKKLLSVLATVGVVASSAVSVVACGTKKEDKEVSKPKDELTEVIQDFEQDVTKIWSEHYEKEVATNLITLEDVNNGYEFLVKSNIQYYSKPENKAKLTVEEKKQFTSDVEKIFKVELLKEKLNELKKVNEYKIILDEVDSVFEHVDLLFNDKFEINSGELSAGVYIGNIIVDYKVVTHYKGKIDVEKFSQLGALKYTSTESKAFKAFGDVMYKNIAKDMFTSSEAKEYLNLKWSDIKGKSDDSDAFGNSNAQLKKYYNENKDFHKALLKIINDKYFKQKFPSLDIAYSKTSIYKTDNFLEKNKDCLIMNNLDDENVIKLNEIDNREKISKILLGDEKLIAKILKDDVFNLLTLEKNKEKYRVARNKFLNGFLSKTEVEKYQKTKYYDLAVAMGYVEFVGPVIKIGNNEFSYDHQLPDFRLAISYSMNGENDLVTNKALIDLSLKLFGVYKKVWNPILTKLELKFGFYYRNNYNDPKNSNKIWSKQYYNEKHLSWTANEVNTYLNNYDKTYFSSLEKNLNLLNMTRNIFKSSNILYSIVVKDYNIQNNIRLAIISDYFIEVSFIIDDNYENNSSTNRDNFWKNWKYIRFNLFGIVKMNIYIDKNSKKVGVF